MSNKDHSNFKLPDRAEKNPFSAPEGYFSTLSARVKEKIQQEESSSAKALDEPSFAKALDDKEEDFRPAISLWSRVKPHLALAAAIIAFALISVTTLQFLLGDKGDQQDYYDLALLDEAGILDESVLQETLDYGLEEEDALSEWEEDAITYLASNDMDLHLLLNEY